MTNAASKLNPFDHPDLAPVPTPRRAGPQYQWSKAKVAALGYMVGLGFSGRQIADVIGCGVPSVSNACSRYHLNLNRRRDGSVVIPAQISKEAAQVLDEASATRAIRRKELVERLIMAISEEGLSFIDNVLDE